MLKHLATYLFGFVALLATLMPAAAEKRVALVIGNAAYQNVPALQNPSHDAADMATKLRALGFDVVEGVDLSKRDMEKHIRAFAEKLVGTDVGLFYYAGHGFQADQRNFLAPIDAQLKSETDLDFEAVQLNLVLKQMVRNARTSLVFLDACRDNPLAANLAQVSRSLAVGRGLARIEAAASMMVVYATEPGKVALDGTGRNSPFTAALLRHIDTEGASISDVMIDVRNDVLKATSGKQRPFESASLTGQFFFKPAQAQTAAGKSSATAAEIAALREQIARLQAVQGQLLKSQQEQLEGLQKKLDEETDPAAQAGSQPDAAVQPSDAASAATSSPAAPAADPGPAEGNKLAAVDSKSPEGEPAGAAETTEPILESATREELAQDMLSELKRLGCYFGRVNGNWGARSQLALERFNRISALELPLEEPEQASLDALKAWESPHCRTEKAVTPRKKARPPAEAAVPKKKKAPARKAAVPKKKAPARKAVRRRAPKAPSAQAVRPRARPSPHSAGGGGAAQRELQRLFPSTAWPGQ